MKYKKNQEADVSSKEIFGNPTLCAQFLRDYSELPMFANVQPEDIEDVTERYHLFREVEFQSDTVKKVHVREQADTEAANIYILSLMEHKSAVDYDVTMQILKYMVCIWENEVKEQETAENQKAGTRKNARKELRYPPIYPIVYYEGSGEWTAARHLKERIMLGELFSAYILDFMYRLVRTQDYSNEELLSREDAISLLMLLNKIQRAKDFQEISPLPTKRLDDILQRAPVDVAEIIVSAVRSLCNRLNLTLEETTDFIRKVKGGNMGYLWENMEKMDIQLERRNTAEQRQRAEEAEKRADEAERDANEQRQRAEEAEKRADEAEKRIQEAEKRIRELEQEIAK
ncbi:MAG: Rpn family recombination-promoting nuclease/putative transposase [Lachnospiraceae bacterium]|nr:Rpn family recombination-promoting nuclease/putative transposase [Lachnospiraceae bacterium]